jgi:hypothetical protein
MPIPLHRTNILLSNSLSLAFQVADIFAAYFMKYKTISNLCIDRVFSLRCRNGRASLPLDMGDGRIGNEAAFVTNKSLAGIGRGFYQTAA